MDLYSANIRLLSKNKNIAFELKSKNLINKLVTKTINKLSSLYIYSNKVVFSERIVEYPLLFQYLDKNWLSILDFGCVEDLIPIHLASLGYEVTGLDLRPYPFTHPNFKFIQADILRYEPPHEEYDCVISISTLEHVDLGGYGDPAAKDGDKIAAAKLYTAVRGGG